MTNDDNQIVEGRRKAKPQMANGEPQNPKLRLKESQNKVEIVELRERERRQEKRGPFASTKLLL